MTTTETIETRIKAFKASSSFTPGDSFSFSIKFSEDIELPGKYDPDDYIRRLATTISDKRVCVVCPGNGGLAVACLKLGAESVVAFEPRDLYHKALDAIGKFAREVLDVSFELSDPVADEPFDVIIWSEGVDDVPSPKATMNKIIDALAPGGLLYLELSHGHHGPLPDSTNCWRPTETAFGETFDGYPRLEIIGKMLGRNQVRKIYTIKNTDKPKVKVLSGPDYQSVEDVQEFAEKLKVVVKEPEGPPPSEMTKEKAIDRIAAKIKQTFEDAPPAPVEDLDEIYDRDSNAVERRVSTPKSRKKTKKKKRGSKTRKGSKRGKSNQ